MKTFNVIDKNSDFVATLSAETPEEAIKFCEELEGKSLYAELIDEEED